MGNALFIVWRESTEALLVVGILYAWLNKHPDVRRGMRYLWGGVATGVGLALVLAAGAKSSVVINALKPGTYVFFDEYHQDAPKGKIVVK